MEQRRSCFISKASSTPINLYVHIMKNLIGGSKKAVRWCNDCTVSLDKIVIITFNLARFLAGKNMMHVNLGQSGPNFYYEGKKVEKEKCYCMFLYPQITVRLLISHLRTCGILNSCWLNSMDSGNGEDSKCINISYILC